MLWDSGRKSRRTVVAAGALFAWAGVLGVCFEARAAEPRLDELAVARGIAAGELEVGASEVVPAGSPRRQVSAERRELTLHGLPVRGAFETLWRADGAPARVVASRYPGRDARLRPEQARVDVDRARDALRSRLRPDQLPRAFEGPNRSAGMDGELVYLMLFDVPVLAWEFTAPLSMGGGGLPPSRERIWVSAASGRVLDTVELVDFQNQAEVYAINPQHTPTPSLVTLPNLDPDPDPWLEDMVAETGFLTGTRVRVFNCIDDEDGPYAPWRNDEAELAECYPTQRVSADLEGDYFVPLPDVTIIADNKNPTDLYAELSMYWHAEQFFTALEARGVEGFPCELSNMVANFHWLEPAPAYPDLGYGPFNNAYYTGTCEIEDGPTMLFGQGSAVDFAFDGDVVYHELGHGIVQHLTPDGLRSFNQREEAVLRDARALNEAIADYHTLMITERPELAEYVGFYWPELEHGWIRNADNDAQCPRDMAGQEHNDSAPVTAALWAAHRRIGGEKMDAVVLGALPLLPGDSSIEQFAAALLEIATAERDAGVWTQGDYDQLERALAARNLIDCERVVDDPINLDEPRFLYLRNNGNYVSPFWPGPVQYRQRIPAGSDNLLVSFEVSAKGNSAGQPVSHDVEPWLLVKRSSVSEDAAIHFEYELAALGHADEESGDVDETWEVFGDWDEIYTPTVLGEARRQVLIRGLEPGEVVHVSFVNSERETVVVRELEFASVPTDELDEGSPGESREPDLPADDGSSCACTSAPSGGSGGGRGGLALSLLVLATLRPRRFRRRSR
jgi:MYXO-CTERM domain-containing protein